MKSFSIWVLIVLLSGCASSPYQYGTGRNEIDGPYYPRMDEQIIQGEPSAFLDASDWIWPGSWLAKLFLWNKDIDSHTVSDETLAYLRQYLDDNQLDDVQVLVNTYKPGNQWRRLFTNKTVSPGWRFTLGILSVAAYSAMPGRFFGGDAYNPYTNTIYIYSDDPAIALHEAGHAKDTGSHENKGNYSAIYALPLVSLYHEAKASNDALSYLQEKQLSDEQKSAYRTLHPAYGTYIGGAATLSGDLDYSILGAIPGHITGNIAALFVKDPEDEADKQDSSLGDQPDVETDLQGSDLESAAQ